MTDFDQSIIDALMWATSNTHGIFLTGEVGAGKTHAAAALLANAFAIERIPENIGLQGQVKWILVPELLLNIRESFSGKSESERELVMQYIKPAILVMDDLGIEKVTDWSTSTLYLIIAKRLDNMKTTIITSNLTFQQLEEWEPRIASRLYMYAKINVGDVDRRVDRAE